MTRTQSPASISSIRYREAEHRHRNTLQMLSSIARRQMRSSTNEESRENLAYVVELIEILARLEEQAIGECKAPLSERLEDMARQWQRLASGHIRVLLGVEDGLEISIAQETVVCLIAYELVLNAFKHAFTGGRTGTVRVDLRRPTKNRLLLVVEDDGVGLPGGMDGRADPKKTVSRHGNTLVDSLAVSIGGFVSRETGSRGGLKVSVHWVE